VDDSKLGDGVRDHFVEMTMICCQLLTELVLALPFQKKNQDRKQHVGMTAAPFHWSVFFKKHDCGFDTKWAAAAHFILIGLATGLYIFICGLISGAVSIMKMR
jgi:hypothetical protein